MQNNRQTMAFTLNNEKENIMRAMEGGVATFDVIEAVMSKAIERINLLFETSLPWIEDMEIDSETENALVSQVEQAQAHLQILVDEKLNAIDQAENVEQVFELVQDIMENIGEQVENIFSSITIDA